MVVLKELPEVKNMFWGVTLDGGKRYTQTVANTFHISMAALEPVPGKKEPVSVMIAHDKSEFMLCTLEPPHCRQQYLDLNFTEGEEVTFYLSGKGVVHLTGYLVPEEEHPYEDSDMDDMDSEEDEDSEDEDEDEAPELTTPDEGKSKRKKKQKDIGVAKKLKLAENSDDDDDDDEEEEEEEEEEEMDSDEEEAALFAALAADSDDDDEDDDEAEEEDDEDDDEEEEDEEEESEEEADLSGSFMQESKVKKEKKATPIKKEVVKQEVPTPVKTPENGESQSSKKKKKKNKNKKKDEDNKPATPSQPPKSPETPKTGKKHVGAGGTIMEDLKSGHGPQAQPGKMIHMYYTGKLMNGKQFDACIKGKPFKFRLGKKDVIKGWETGVAGMKVGGKRKLTIPPSQGYGSQKMGPIPANSTLVFEVELKAVS